MKAMILAAGLGERMRPLTHTIPKPLLRIGDRCLIEYHLKALQKAGVQEVIINIAPHARQIIDRLGDGQQFNLNITYSYEEQGPYGTGGGIYQALPLLGKHPFILLSADIATDFDYASLMNKTVATAYLVMVNNPDYHPQGDFCLLADGNITLDQPKQTYANIALLNPQLFAGQKSGNYSLAPILLAAIAAGGVKGEEYAGLWYNIGTPEQLQMIQEAGHPAAEL